MSKHYVCGQFEDAYRPKKLQVWEAKPHLRPPSKPEKTVSAEDWRAKPVTKHVVNDQGHLLNRKKGHGSSFASLPPPATHGATAPRWPTTQPNAVVPYAARATLGYKGIPTNLGFTSTVKMPTECFFSTTR